MKQPQPGRMQPMLFNPFTLWTDIALKTGEIMLASAQAVERKAKSGDFTETAASLTRRTNALTREIMAPNGNGSQRRRAKANGKAKRSAKRRTKR